MNEFVKLFHQWQREGNSSHHHALDSIPYRASSLHSPCSGSEQLLRKGSSAAQLNLESVFLCEEFQRIQPKKLQMIGNFPVKNRAFPHIFPHLAGSQNDFPAVVQERSQPFKQSVDSRDMRENVDQRDDVETPGRRKVLNRYVKHLAVCNSPSLRRALPIQCNSRSVQVGPHRQPFQQVTAPAANVEDRRSLHTLLLDQFEIVAVEIDLIFIMFRRLKKLEILIRLRRHNLMLSVNILRIRINEE